jgi:hypothetical protein
VLRHTTAAWQRRATLPTPQLHRLRTLPPATPRIHPQRLPQRQARRQLCMATSPLLCTCPARRLHSTRRPVDARAQVAAAAARRRSCRTRLPTRSFKATRLAATAQLAPPRKPALGPCTPQCQATRLRSPRLQAMAALLPTLAHRPWANPAWARAMAGTLICSRLANLSLPQAQEASSPATHSRAGSQSRPQTPMLHPSPITLIQAPRYLTTFTHTADLAPMQRQQAMGMALPLAVTIAILHSASWVVTMQGHQRIHMHRDLVPISALGMFTM